MQLNSVIILSFNKFSTTTGPCLDSLAEDPDFSSWDVLVVDNASDQPTRSALGIAAHKYPSVRVFLSERNRGFSGGMNFGMQQARGDIFVLLNSDTFVPVGMVGRIATAVRSSQGIGLLSPVTNAAGNEQGIFTKSADRDGAIFEGLQFANAKGGTSTVRAYRLDFCCVALRKSVYEALGGLDEEFGRGYYEDFDYSLRAREAGLDLAVLEDAFIYHQGGSSFKDLGKETKRLIERNKTLLLKKHNNRVQFPHSRDANLAVLQQYAIMQGAGLEPPAYRIENRLTQATINRPRSWWKRWRYIRNVAAIQKCLIRFSDAKIKE